MDQEQVLDHCWAQLGPCLGLLAIQSVHICKYASSSGILHERELTGTSGMTGDGSVDDMGCTAAIEATRASDSVSSWVTSFSLSTGVSSCCRCLSILLSTSISGCSPPSCPCRPSSFARSPTDGRLSDSDSESSLLDESLLPLSLLSPLPSPSILSSVPWWICSSCLNVEW